MQHCLFSFLPQSTLYIGQVFYLTINGNKTGLPRQKFQSFWHCVGDTGDFFKGSADGSIVSQQAHDRDILC